MTTFKQPLPEDYWETERRLAEIARMNHRLPGIHVVRDDGALQAYETALHAQERRVLMNELQPPRWKKAAVWLGMVLFCAAAWYAIIRGVVALGDFLTEVLR